MSMTVEQAVLEIDAYNKASPLLNEQIAQAFVDLGILEETPPLVAAGMATVLQWMLEQEMIQ